MRDTGTLVQRAARGVNAWMVALQSSPWSGRLVGRYLTVITYTGRRSGQVYSAPVSYKRDGDIVTVRVGMPDGKNWWRNFTGDGGPISLQLEGRDREGHAVASRDAQGRVTVAIQLRD